MPPDNDAAGRTEKRSVGADSIRPDVSGTERFVGWEKFPVIVLGFPRGEAGRLDGSSEPARLTDEGQRYLKVSDFPVEW